MKSNVGSVLRGIGFLFIFLYLFAGIGLGSAYGTQFNFFIAVSVWFVGATISTIIIAIGTIVEQLNGIVDLQNSVNEINEKLKETEKQKEGSLSEQEKNSMHIVPSKIEKGPTVSTTIEPIDLSQREVNQKKEFHIDRSKEMIDCPNCGCHQSSDRSLCFRCEAKFI